MPGVAEVHWPAAREAWLHVARGVESNGLPTLVLGSFVPEHLFELRARRWVGNVHFLVLDCPDDERVRRIEARPAWRGRSIDGQLDFARWLRTNIASVIDTGTATPVEAAADVAAWVRSALHAD